MKVNLEALDDLVREEVGSVSRVGLIDFDEGACIVYKNGAERAFILVHMVDPMGPATYAVRSLIETQFSQVEQIVKGSVLAVAGEGEFKVTRVIVANEKQLDALGLGNTPTGNDEEDPLGVSLVIEVAA